MSKATEEDRAGVNVRCSGISHVQATQVRIAPFAELRGKGKILTPRVGALDLAWLEDDGRTSTETLYFSFITGQWKMIWPRDVGTIDFAGKLKLLTQVQFERRYLWRAVIGTPSAPSISFNQINHRLTLEGGTARAQEPRGCATTRR